MVRNGDNGCGPESVLEPKLSKMAGLLHLSNATASTAITPPALVRAVDASQLSVELAKVVYFSPVAPNIEEPLPARQIVAHVAGRISSVRPMTFLPDDVEP